MIVSDPTLGPTHRGDNSQSSPAPSSLSTAISGSISLLVINKENSHQAFVQSHSSLIKRRDHL